MTTHAVPAQKQAARSTAKSRVQPNRASAAAVPIVPRTTIQSRLILSRRNRCPNEPKIAPALIALSSTP